MILSIIGTDPTCDIYDLTHYHQMAATTVLKEKLELERVIFGIPLPGALDLTSVLTNAQKFQSSFFIEPKEPPTALQLVALRRDDSTIFLYTKVNR